VIAELRRVIEAQRRELVGEVRKLRRHQRNETEAVPVLQRRVLDLERHTGLVENPKAPKPSRRGPEGGVSVITAMSRGHSGSRRHGKRTGCYGDLQQRMA